MTREVAVRRVEWSCVWLCEHPEGQPEHLKLGVFQMLHGRGPSETRFDLYVI